MSGTHVLDTWAVASMTTTLRLRAIELVAMHRKAKSTADTRPQTQRYESVRYDRV